MGWVQDRWMAPDNTVYWQSGLNKFGIVAGRLGNESVPRISRSTLSAQLQGPVYLLLC